MSVSLSLSRLWKKYNTAVLLSFWALGSALGTVVACRISQEAASAVRNAVSQPVSISGVLVVDVLPFLICGLAIVFAELWLIPFIACAKAFGFAFNACAITVAFGSSGWLIRCLLLFSDMLLIPALCVFCLRYSKRNLVRMRREIHAWAVLVALVGCLDFCVVSPFLARLF